MLNFKNHILQLSYEPWPFAIMQRTMREQSSRISAHKGACMVPDDSLKQWGKFTMRISHL